VSATIGRDHVIDLIDNVLFAAMRMSAFGA
jgi:hypothetical protein